MVYRIKNIRLILHTIVSVLLISIVFSSFRYTEGTPEGYTGAPTDGKDCSACHKAKSKTVDDIITCNTENNTYEPLKTYSIKMHLKGNEKSKIFGFQISPQNNKGKLSGKMIVTDAKQTKLANAKYLNQTAAGVDGNVEKIWTFDWVAPAKGSGMLTFYGSFLIGGKTEIVYNSILQLNEKK